MMSRATDQPCPVMARARFVCTTGSVWASIWPGMGVVSTPLRRLVRLCSIAKARFRRGHPQEIQGQSQSFAHFGFGVKSAGPVFWRASARDCAGHSKPVPRSAAQAIAPLAGVAHLNPYRDGRDSLLSCTLFPDHPVLDAEGRGEVLSWRAEPVFLGRICRGRGNAEIHGGLAANAKPLG